MSKASVPALLSITPPYSAMLPEPAEFLQQHSRALAEHIAVGIKENGGWISFESYMDQALYTPGLGYYAAGLQKLGEEGDFITAPLLGTLFAACLARQCQEIFQQFPQDKPRVIVEFGAGNGQLAHDLIQEMMQLQSRVDRYLIIETSADLQQRQKENLCPMAGAFAGEIEWLTALPETVEGVIIANELLDALPVKRFQIDDTGQAVELGVTENQGEFQWQVSNQPLAMSQQDRLRNYGLPLGYCSEINVQGEAWVRSVGESLASGVILLIDYGFNSREFYHPDRTQGTLMCHYRHYAHDNPFYYPGLQDITAHIDFTAISEAADEVGLQLAGYASQGSFLLSLGILDKLQACQEEMTHDSQKMLQLSQQIKKLTLPHEMGELFKVMALSKNFSCSLNGFSIQNHMGRL